METKKIEITERKSNKNCDTEKKNPVPITQFSFGKGKISVG